MPRSVRIDGSATPIIETSRASRNSAPQSTSSVLQARRLNRSVPVSSEVVVTSVVSPAVCGPIGPGLIGPIIDVASAHVNRVGPIGPLDLLQEVGNGATT